jgi:hypothetical protein
LRKAESGAVNLPGPCILFFSTLLPRAKVLVLF